MIRLFLPGERMSARYAYSFNGENYIGNYAKRSDALAEAHGRLKALSDRPQTIYVGRLNVPDLHLTGHARGVLDEIRRRTLLEVGAVGVEHLERVGEKLVEELDREIANTVRSGLQKHELRPAQFKVDQISEHAVPPPPMVESTGSGVAEVKDIGESLPL
jgi:hypothetical protein